LSLLKVGVQIDTCTKAKFWSQYKFVKSLILGFQSKPSLTIEKRGLGVKRANVYPIKIFLGYGRPSLPGFNSLLALC
jgi:hypothetical protein